MQPVLVRIDDRLIHGQVMTGWLKVTGAKKIIIADDFVAKDKFSLQLFKMAAPNGISVEALTVEDAARALTEDNSGDEKVIVLCKTPREPKRLLESGVEFDKLNVGGVGSKPGRKPFYRNISLSEEELSILKEIAASGVKVEFRIVPDDKPFFLE